MEIFFLNMFTDKVHINKEVRISTITPRQKITHLTISAQRTRTELELGLVMKRTVCGWDSHFSKI
jgi:hypothetical protein